MSATPEYRAEPPPRVPAGRPQSTIRVLLVDEDARDNATIRHLLAADEPDHFTVDWRQTSETGIAAVSASPYDVVLLDNSYGAVTALDFLGQLPPGKSTPPVILLTGQEEQRPDFLAVKSGVADYVAKLGLNTTMLQRSIHYSVERHRAALAKHDMEARYQLLVESVGAIVWQANPRTLRFSFVSREAESLLGYPLTEWTTVASFWPRHMHPDDRQWVLEACAEAVRTREPRTFDYRMLSASDGLVWLRNTVCVSELAGRPALTGVMLDVTAEKKVEEWLRLQERAMAAIAEGIVIADCRQPDCPIVYVNPAVELLTGYTASEMLGRNCRFLQGPTRDQEAIAPIRSAVATGVAATAELLNYKKDGTPFWNCLTLRPVHDAHGALTHFVGVQRDVTESKAANLKLLAAKEHYRSLVMTSPQAIYALDAEGRFVELNAAGEAVLGRPASEMLGQHYSVAILVEDLHIAIDAVQRTLDGLVGAFEFELRVVRGDGEVRLLSIAATSAREMGTITGQLGVARDITDERRRKHKLVQLSTALENLRDDAVSIQHENGKFVYANGAHARLYGYDPGMLDTLRNDAFLPDAGAAEEMRQIVAKVKDGESWSGMWRRTRIDDASEVMVDVAAGGVLEDGRTLLFVVSRDAHARLADAQHLRRVERLAGIGTLVAGVAHELNNPLSAVLGLAQLLLLEPRSDSDRDDLQTIIREAERMAKIVADLRAVARNTQDPGPQLDLVDLND
ncbi:MAG: PAS domain S-box protein, partial [bacterium]